MACNVSGKEGQCELIPTATPTQTPTATSTLPQMASAVTVTVATGNGVQGGSLTLTLSLTRQSSDPILVSAQVDVLFDTSQIQIGGACSDTGASCNVSSDCAATATCNFPCAPDPRLTQQSFSAMLVTMVSPPDPTGTARLRLAIFDSIQFPTASLDSGTLATCTFQVPASAVPNQPVTLTTDRVVVSDNNNNTVPGVQVQVTSGTILPAPLVVNGTCMEPGAQGLVPCTAGTVVTAYLCTDPSCSTLIALEVTQTDANGEFVFVLDRGQVAGKRLVFDATIVEAGGALTTRRRAASDTTVDIRIIDFGPIGAVTNLSELIDLTSEAAVQLVDANGGAQHYSDQGIKDIIQAVRTADSGINFAGLTAAAAATLATDTAGNDPMVQAALQMKLCTGDCNGDGAVTVDEILTMVNIVLGIEDVSTCLPGDANNDKMITVDEILTAVNNALKGCGGIAATPTPTPVPGCHSDAECTNPTYPYCGPDGGCWSQPCADVCSGGQSCCGGDAPYCGPDTRCWSAPCTTLGGDTCCGPNQQCLDQATCSQ